MLRLKILPALYLLFAILSLLFLRSVAPGLVITQLLFFITGGIVFAVTSHINYFQLERWHWLLYVGLLASLLFLLVEGNITRGSTRWISFFGLFNIQPSQLAIPIVLLTVGKVVMKARTLSWREVALFLGILGIPSILILVEPDLGTTLVLVATLGSVLWLSPVSSKILFSLGASAVVVAVLGWLFLLHPYQKARLTNFLFNHSDSSQNYNAYQALVAVGSGQMWGRGLGYGVQSHLKFLPERHTDFIFAALGEETGFVGASFVVLSYAFLVIFIGFIAERSTGAERYFCWGVASMIVIQTSINIGMNIGLVPITGVTLPLISYGGSSLLTTSALYGVVQSIAREHKKKSILNIN